MSSVRNLIGSMFEAARQSEHRRIALEATSLKLAQTVRDLEGERDLRERFVSNHRPQRSEDTL
ncbi:MAG: hypothetical protein H7222_09740 [Methylotenera sp.]|nr:hypothetical protein [Oligoflexia bacterium]